MNDLISRQRAITALAFAKETGSMKCGELKGVFEVLKRLPSGPHWIPCSEKLPEESGLYLVTERGMFGESVYTRYWNYDRSGRNAHWSGYGNSAEVTAWCELPEPYEGVTT